MNKFTSISNARKETKLAYLGRINASSKLIKNMKVSGTYTYSIMLAPASESGYNVCSHSTPECRLGCLATSGRAGIELMSGRTRAKNSRINKAKLFFENTEYFMNWMIAEMKMYQAKAIKDNYSFSARLNTTSDIDWANVRMNGKNIFEMFPDVIFYDYTKNFNKVKNNIYPNYDLTYSYTGRNLDKAVEVLKMGLNVAVVYNAKRNELLPETFEGYKVINGDLTDFRIDDEKGCVVGLHWKHIANKIVEKQILESCFVVNK